MGIFASQSKLLQRYRAQLKFRGKVFGGIPNDPKLVKGWLESVGGITQEDELRVLTARTLEERGAVDGWPTYADVSEVAEKVAEVKMNGFKRDEHGLYIEGRQVKAGLKEATNILYAGDRWGATKKGPKSYLAERVFVAPDRIYLGRMSADGIETLIGHVPSPQGPKSTIGQVEYVEGAEIAFDVLVTQDCIKPEWWADLWEQLQLLGLGAVRSQGYGTFDVLAWDKVDPASNAPEPLPLALA